MAPPQQIHHEEHHGILHVHHDLHQNDAEEKSDGPPLETCRQCRTKLAVAAQFCSECGQQRPEILLPGQRKLSFIEKDCVNESGIRRTAWLFVHAEVMDSPCILRYGGKYELMSIGFVVYLVVADIFVSIHEVGQYFHDSIVLHGFEALIYAIFTVEYCTRVWSCMESKEYAELGPIKGRLKLMRGAIECVDFIVLFAYYIMFIPGFDKLKGLSALRMIRLLRVAALLKVERKTSSFSKIVAVLKSKKSELMATLFTAAVLMVMSATTIYYLEVGAQPTNFGSVPAAMWWSVTALTTVGYGDVVPMTAGGKFVASITAFFGVGLFALPAGILGSGFVEEVEKARHLAAMAEEFQDDDGVGSELLEEEEEEEALISDIAAEVETLRSTAVSLHSGQNEILKLLRSIDPSFDFQSPSVDTSMDTETLRRLGPDQELAALQESVHLKLKKLKQKRQKR